MTADPAPPSRPWWQTAVMYQVYPRSFGTLDAIRERLDHLEWLGIDAVWLSPFYPSPQADMGYDVSDHCDVDPMFGTLADFDRFLAEAHARDIRVLVDFVPNHTSIEHPWFRDPSKHDWYVWRDGSPATPPNNWVGAFLHGPAWTWDSDWKQWYLHLFLPEQPDLNWANPEVKAAMHGVMRFWLDRGVDGFRVDVVHGLGKDPALPDDPPDMVAARIPHSALNDDPRTHPIIRRMRQVVEEYDGDRVLVGEVYLLDTHKVVQYFGDGDELHLAFNFPPLYAPWEAAKWRRQVERAEREHGAVGAWPTWVLSNHDNPRHRTRYGGSEHRARQAAMLLLTLRGTPFLYQGEELGLEDAVIPPEEQQDPGGRDGCRAPIPWERADVQRDDPGSILNHYRRLIAERRASPALQTGDLRLLDDAPSGALAYERVATGDRRRIEIDFS